MSPLQKSLSHVVDVFHGNFEYLSLDLVMKVDGLFGAVDVVGEVVVVQIFPHILQSVQHIGALPKEIFEGLQRKKTVKLFFFVQKKATHVENESFLQLFADLFIFAISPNRYRFVCYK